MLLAIDPGKYTGWAIFNLGMLQKCGLGDPPNISGQVIIEHPVIYPHGRTRNPNDIVKLAVNAGMHAGRYEATGSRVTFVQPREWKGTIDGDTCNERVWARLQPYEQKLFAEQTKPIALSKRHNVLDAIGIGLFTLGRWKP